MTRRWFWTVCGMVFLLSHGSQMGPAAATQPIRKPTARPLSIQVSTKPTALRAARALAAAQAAANQREEDDKLLSLASSDPEAFAQLRRESARLTPVLRKRLAGRNPVRWQRAQAAFLLLRLDDPAGTEAARQMLQDRVSAPAALPELANLPAADRAKLGNVEQLILRCLDDQDETVRRGAVEAAVRLNSPETNQKLLEVIRSGGDPTGRAAFGLAQTAPSLELLQLCNTQLRAAQADNHYWWLMAAAELTRSREPRVASSAVAVCADTLRTSSDPLGIDGGTLAALEALEKTPDRRGAPLLAMLVRARSASPLVRGAALQSLARRDPAQGRQLALGLLSDSELSRVAVSALGMANRGSADPKLVEMLAQTAQRNPKDQVLAGFVTNALLQIGGESALKSAVALADRVDPEERAAIRWAQHGITREKALDRLAALKLIDPRAATAARKKLATPRAPEAEGPDTRAGSEMIWTGLGGDPDFAPSSGFLETVFEAAGRLTAFDSETDELPVRHDRLLRQLAAHSGGAFKPEALYQRWEQRSKDDEDAPYSVQFIHAGRLYRFSAQNLGDWYDVSTVLGAANRALADAGETRRFVSLDVDSQDAYIVFVSPSALEVAVRELYLAGSADPDNARRAGKAFEEGVVKRIRKPK